MRKAGFRFISKDDPNYESLKNSGTTSLSSNFAPLTTGALRQMGKDKGWDIGKSAVEFNRIVGQAFREAAFKLYKSKLLPVQQALVTYQPQNIKSSYRFQKYPTSSQGQVIPDWTYSPVGTTSPFSLPNHIFYDAKAISSMLYLSSSNYQVAGFIDTLSKMSADDAPPPTMIFITPVNTNQSKYNCNSCF